MPVSNVFWTDPWAGPNIQSSADSLGILHHLPLHTQPHVLQMKSARLRSLEARCCKVPGAGSLLQESIDLLAQVAQDVQRADYATVCLFVTSGAARSVGLLVSSPWLGVPPSFIQQVWDAANAVTQEIHKRTKTHVPISQDSPDLTVRDSAVNVTLGILWSCPPLWLLARVCLISLHMEKCAVRADESSTPSDSPRLIHTDR